VASIVRSRFVVGSLVALISLVLQAMPAVAVIDHENPYLWGNYGVHILIDGGEPYAGVDCHYTAGHLDSMRIRRPIAFPDGPAQYIGWRYQIEGSDDGTTWHTLLTSSLEKVWAPAKQPAPFTTKFRQLSGLVYADYRVVDKIFWFKPSSHIDGKAFIAVEAYHEASGSGDWFDSCPKDEVIKDLSTTGPPPNPDEKYTAGTYGVNILIDESDDWSYTGAACYYDAGLALDKIRIRRPIAFPSGHNQYISWQYVIEGTMDTADPWTASWTHVTNGPLEKVWAKTPQPARFLPKFFNPAGPLDFLLYRVVVKVYWYKNATSINGRSYMAIESYEDVGSNPRNVFVLGCPANHPFT
jgi:hypothetical protein